VTGSAREALIAEALGDLAALLERIDAVRPSIESACADLTRASTAMVDVATDAEDRIKAVAQSATALAVKRIARRANETVASAADRETAALRAVAAEVLRTELGASLRGITQVLGQRSVLAQRTRAIWGAAVSGAIGGASITGAVSAYLWWH
jgi:hypothetical protein